METLVIEKGNALKAYNKADAKGKQLLEDLFEKKFLPGKITDRIKTFQDACEVLGISSFSYSSADTADEMAYKKLKIIIQALNEGWTPDWGNQSQYKYWPWFKMSGSALVYYYPYDYHYSRSTVGSRLCLHSKELAEYVGTQFKDLYSDLFIIKS